jgi:tRNA (cytidine/uridine-2'-O-)-methyltransferase
LGFDISDRAVKRAGLTYWPLVDLHVYDDLEDFFRQHPHPDLWLATSKGTLPHTGAGFQDGCWLFFGKETAGLPQSLLDAYPQRCIRIPMRPVPEARCLNLSNSVAVVTYEALRQQGFPGLYPG